MKRSRAKTPQHLKFAVLAADIALFTVKEGGLFIRLMHVHRPPYFQESVGLPGGLLHPKETAEETGRRLIKERAGIDPKKVYMEQLYTFSAINRDPRGRVVAVAYLACVPWEKLTEKEQADTTHTWWKKVADLPRLAYDHKEIARVAIRRLQTKIRYTTIIQTLLPKEFTLSTLEKTYAIILQKKLDKRNFRKKILKLKILKRLHQKTRGTQWRPAELYSFAQKNILEMDLL